MQSITEYLFEAFDKSSEKLNDLIQKIIKIYEEVDKSSKDDIKCTRFEPGNIVMYIWGNKRIGFEYSLYRFDKYNTYTAWSYGSKIKETGSAIYAKCTEIKESKGVFVAKGAKDTSKLYNEKHSIHAYFPVAVDLDDLNSGNIIDVKKLKEIVNGKRINDVMLASKGNIEEFKKDNIDSKFFAIKKSFDSSLYTIADKFFKPGNIILTIDTETGKLCLSELHSFSKGRIPGERATKNGKLTFAKTDIIYPNFSKTKPDKLPDWYDADMLSIYGERRNYLYKKNNFVIANSLKDLINGNYLTYEDNEDLLDKVYSDNEEESNKVSDKIKEYKEKMKKILAPYTEVKQRQRKISEDTINKLIKMQPKTYNDVIKVWNKAIEKMEFEQVTGNKTEYEGKLINTSGSYYATSEKNGDIEELGAPCISTTRKNIEEMHEMFVNEFNKWKNENYPEISIDKAYFLSPVILIIGNNGKVGITSAGVDVPASENWYISTNNGKSAAGLYKVKTDKVMLIPNITSWPKNLYTFK